MFHKLADGQTSPITLQTSRDLCDGDAERRETAQDGDTNLELRDLPVEVARDEARTQPFHTMPLRFDAVSAVVSAPSSPQRGA